MPAYLVRLIDTRDLVGFFFAEDADDLELVVDECTDVPDCEYVELPDGGIMWESPAIDVPFQFDKDSPEPPDEEDVPKVPWSGASLTESWWSVVYGYTDEQWTSFVPQDPLKPRPPAPRRPLGGGAGNSHKKKALSLRLRLQPQIYKPADGFKWATASP
jgi:hypothetical protein